MPRTPRMDQIEAMLADDPDDAFLRYGLAMEHAGQGDDDTAATVLRDLLARSPYVPAFHMLGQALGRLGRDSEAVEVLRTGVAAATKAGDLHAAGEMQGLLSTLE